MSNSEHENFLEFSLRTPDGIKNFVAEDYDDFGEIARNLTAEEIHEYLLESVKINGLQMADDQSIRTLQDLYNYLVVHDPVLKAINKDIIERLTLRNSLRDLIEQDHPQGEHYLQFNLKTYDGTKSFVAENYTDLSEIANKFSEEEKHEYKLESAKYYGVPMAVFDDSRKHVFQEFFHYMTLLKDAEEVVDAVNEENFSRQVDESIKGNMPFYKSLKVGRTPDILIQAGCKQLPMLYTQRHLRDAVRPLNEKKHHHGLSIDQIKKLPELLKSPVMMFDSLSRKDSIVIVTSEYDVKENPVLVSIRPNGKGKYEIEEVDANFITSVYGRNNFSGLIERVVKSDSLLYCDKQKSQVLFERLGEQYSKLTNNLDFNKIIHQSNNIVKNETLEKSGKNAPEHPAFKIQYYEANEKKSVYADKLEAGLETIRNKTADLKDTDRCYVGIYNGDAGKYVPSDIYLIKSGENITPVPLELPNVRGKEAFTKLTSGIKALGAKFDGKQWTVMKNLPTENLKKIDDLLARFDPDKTYLTLPAMGREKFKMLTEKLKEDGARFDPARKQWYITKACDREKFNDYISGEHSSVLEKLQEAKENVAAKSGDGSVNKEVNREAAAR